MKRRMRAYRWSRKLLIPLAALPLFQGTTCIQQDLTNAFISQLVVGGVQLAIGAVNGAILQALPEADVIQILLGGNRTPFFPQ